MLFKTNYKHSIHTTEVQPQHHFILCWTEDSNDISILQGQMKVHVKNFSTRKIIKPHLPQDRVFSTRKISFTCKWLPGILNLHKNLAASYYWKPSCRESYSPFQKGIPFLTFRHKLLTEVQGLFSSTTSKLEETLHLLWKLSKGKEACFWSH